jgi:hypothetical protein
MGIHWSSLPELQVDVFELLLVSQREKPVSCKRKTIHQYPNSSSWDSNDPEVQPLLFVMFLSMYLVTVLRNLLIILATSSDSHLHTSMYLFLSELPLIDICFTSTTVPKMLVNIQEQRKDIS